ncbi:hypothetical protein PSH03_005381 [Micromonospora sp. PSH03]|uniref:hypothetical protein n=1 Tax=Micromonospora salmantinae TaxID=2911211 RepID=UPI001EE925B4|nr:hypothetical protein [Micromonospora salmantinae]MCG5459599.1 hypothetical protein [Micromonospora salmantinae]
MTETFNVGDRVVYTGNHPEYSEASRVGNFGTVTEIRHRNDSIGVSWDNDPDLHPGHFAQNLGKAPHNFKIGDRVKHVLTGDPGIVTNLDSGFGFSGRYINVDFQRRSSGNYYPWSVEAAPEPVKPLVLGVGAKVRIRDSAWKMSGHRSGQTATVMERQGSGCMIDVDGITGYYFASELEVIENAPTVNPVTTTEGHAIGDVVEYVRADLGAIAWRIGDTGVITDIRDDYSITVDWDGGGVSKHPKRYLLRRTDRNGATATGPAAKRPEFAAGDNITPGSILTPEAFATALGLPAGPLTVDPEYATTDVTDTPDAASELRNAAEAMRTKADQMSDAADGMDSLADLLDAILDAA